MFLMLYFDSSSQTKEKRASLLLLVLLRSLGVLIVDLASCPDRQKIRRRRKKEKIEDHLPNYRKKRERLWHLLHSILLSFFFCETLFVSSPLIFFLFFWIFYPLASTDAALASMPSHSTPAGGGALVTPRSRFSSAAAARNGAGGGWCWCWWPASSSVASVALISLVALVVQNSTLVLMTRYSRFSQPAAERYYTSTLVLNQEIVKMALCLVLFFFERPSEHSCGGGSSYLDRLKEVVIQRSTMKLCLPAALFTLQNFLIFVALSHLDAMTFQMLSQTKLLSAAVFSVLLLDRRLNAWQWISLILLTLGVFLSQADTTHATSSSSFIKASKTPGGVTPPPPSPDKLAAVEREMLSQNPLIGGLACVISGLSSSFAGVYFEKVVKTTSPSLAVRNIHLGIFGIPLAFLSMLVLDVAPTWYTPPSSASPTTGEQFRYWRGYNTLTVMLVFVHALGGLLVAVVAKYADNILKGFATGVAIVVSGLFGWIFWDYHPTIMFVGGCMLVTISTMVYHHKDGGPGAGRLPAKESKEEV
jgi:UDP-sugar transporter A1/2/3